MDQITLISFFKYEGLKNKWEAFTRMGRPPLAEGNIEGLSFWKALGSGAGNGFSIWPDFSTFGLLTVFNSKESAENFLKSSALLEYQNTAKEFSHVFMRNIKSHGIWSGKKPFTADEETKVKTQEIAVITRATIKPKLAYKFWKNTPKVAKSMENFPGLIYSKGIGEWPIFMQATFSLWENKESMMAYAYKNKSHSEMVKKTQELQWYSEELFARFEPLEIRGDLIPR